MAPDDPGEWLARARSNLALAGAALPGVYLEDLCFEAQQAAEKALKALLIARGVAFPYVHDLAHLLTLIEGVGLEVPAEVLRSATLSKYAVSTRYPGISGPVTLEMHRDAVGIATEVVAWVEAQLER